MENMAWMDRCEPGMDHIDTVLESYLNDVVLGKIRAHRSEPFADLIGLVGLDADMRMVTRTPQRIVRTF